MLRVSVKEVRSVAGSDVAIAPLSEPAAANLLDSALAGDTQQRLSVAQVFAANLPEARYRGPAGRASSACSATPTPPSATQPPRQSRG